MNQTDPSRCNRDDPSTHLTREQMKLLKEKLLQFVDEELAKESKRENQASMSDIKVDTAGTRKQYKLNKTFKNKNVHQNSENVPSKSACQPSSYDETPTKNAQERCMPSNVSRKQADSRKGKSASKSKTNKQNCATKQTVIMNKSTTKFLKQFVAYSKYCCKVCKDVFLFFVCLLLMVVIFLCKVLWYLVCNALRLLLVVLLVSLMWFNIKLSKLWNYWNVKYEIWHKCKKWTSVMIDVFDLVFGVNARAWFKKKRTISTEDDISQLVTMPSSSEEAVKHLLCQQKSPFRALCSKPIDTDEMIRANYRGIARLVHPDKTDQPDAAEAFKILDACFKKISTENSRQEQIELRRFEQQQRAFDEQFEGGAFQKVFEELRNLIPCDRCQGKHRRNLVSNRSQLMARYCASCKTNHPAENGDVWAETNSFGVSWICYACMEGQVYELTEWAKCHDLQQSLVTNSHIVQCRLGSQSKSSSKTSNKKKAAENDLPRKRRSKKPKKPK